MEGDSEGEKNVTPTEGGETKTRRKMKTAAQLEILEKTYAAEAYPSEATRVRLSAQLQLSDRQLQMWFCHRRLKERKPQQTLKRKRKDPTSPRAEEVAAIELMAAPSSPVVEMRDMRKVVLRPGMAGASSPVVDPTKVVFRPGMAAASCPFVDMEDLREVVLRPGMAAKSSPAVDAEDPRKVVLSNGIGAAPSPVVDMGYQREVVSRRGTAATSSPFVDMGDLKKVGMVPGMAMTSSLVEDMGDQRKAVLRPGIAVPRIRPSPQPAVELMVIAFVEEQLGEKLREDAPVLGMEFDLLPPGAFGMPIEPFPSLDAAETSVNKNQDAQSFETKLFELPVAKPVKTPREYQFLPEQPTATIDQYRKVAASKYYGSHGDTPIDPSGGGGGIIMHGDAQLPIYRLTPEIPNLNLMSHHGRSVSPALVKYASPQMENCATNTAQDPNMGANPRNAVVDNFILPDRKVSHEDEMLRIEKKRKIEEARVAREVEANEKRLRKELEKQEMLRRKREEQMRKDMERQERERRKEEEKILREKQREEERCLRDQRREQERREKFLLKEYIKAEKMKQREEQRQEREAVRRKAAYERASARRQAKDSMELPDDEHLELMELAASNKGLLSVASLNVETLQSLDLYRDKLKVFPPQTVQLKRPFAVQPWTSSEENIGNLLMVWRFLITFTDILGIWPFTLDEFIQALHDFDPRLLGEVHIALIKTIIKDIEDVARVSSIGQGANQHTATNLTGGHPQIVEGAYAWGLDARSWQQHLNPLTWPEILRQIALSAGFGPRLRKTDIDHAIPPYEKEGNNGEDIISILRNGAAAKKAVEKMQLRGYLSSRRSRHRLTPGTVKFAAYYVLSFEGDNGLTILEVADKIQKSGLRDLTTSKTPEASIAAALSRDTKLFERVAPSTYCVLPPFRKNPSDADAILSAARRRVEIFAGGTTNAEDVDEVEKNEDSDSDPVDDAEVEYLGKEENVETRETQVSNPETPLTNGKDCLKVTKMVLDDENGKDCVMGTKTDLDDEDMDIDENNLGESWVQGLTENDYSDLSVEQRLNALVALVGLANEGNSIRGALEERMEAANALKRQMWAEAQLDKRSFKEEYLTKMHFPSNGANKSEPGIKIRAAEGSPLLTPEKNIGTFTDPFLNREGSTDLQNEQSYDVEKSRSRLKSYIGYRAEELYLSTSLPLGQDRRRNRYWHFTTSNSWNDPGAARIFVEFIDGTWRLIDSEEGIDALLSCLDVRGVRESSLHFVLQKIKISFKEAIRRNKLTSTLIQRGYSVETDAFNTKATSTAFKIELGRNEIERNKAFRRYLDFEKWIWKYPYRLCSNKYGKKRCEQMLIMCNYCRDIYFSENSKCPSCHNRTLGANTNRAEKWKVDLCSVTTSAPLRMRLLKVQLALIEASIPLDALHPIWSESYRSSWGLKLHSSTSADEMLQVLAMLEGALKSEFLSSDFDTTREILGEGEPTDCTALESVSILPWIPKTMAAVSLRLMELDNSLTYDPSLIIEPNFKKLPSRNIANNITNVKTAEIPYQAGCTEKASWVEVGIEPTHARGRGRGRHTHGTNPQTRVTCPRLGSRRKKTPTRNIKGPSRVRGACRSRRRAGRPSSSTSRRTTKTQQKPSTSENKILENTESSSRVENELGWNDENVMTGLQMEGNSSDKSEYNDVENRQLIATDEYEDEVISEHSEYNNNGDVIREFIDDEDSDSDDQNENSFGYQVTSSPPSEYSE